MRNAILSAAALPSLLLATPALAGETYAEVTGGISWNKEESAAVLGVAGGYDFELNEKNFAGIEAIAEKELADDTRVSWGIGGRFGGRLISGAKVYAGANWQSKDCGECSDAIGLTAGWEQDLSEKLYAKIEYKHLLIGDGERDKDLAIVGLGVKF